MFPVTRRKASFSVPSYKAVTLVVSSVCKVEDMQEGKGFAKKKKKKSASIVQRY